MVPTGSIAAVPSVPRLTFAEMLWRLYAEQHTGPVILHFAQGHAVKVEIPSEPTRIALDTRRKGSR